MNAELRIYRLLAFCLGRGGELRLAFKASAGVAVLPILDSCRWYAQAVENLGRRAAATSAVISFLAQQHLAFECVSKR